MEDNEWVRAPRQARSQATLERFVEATQELLTARPFEEITVADIVSKADRTVGSFYARFDDKYAVLHVLIERLDERVRALVQAFCDPVRWEGRPIEEFVYESVQLNVMAYRRSTSLFKAALTAAATDQRFREQRQRTMQFCAEKQKAFVLTRADELDTKDPARASDIWFELVGATLDHELLFGRFTTTSPQCDSDLVRELTDQVLFVLGARGTWPPPDQAETASAANA